MSILICVVTSLLLTLTVARIARRKHLFDIPNERSSHAIPTPRLGGIAVFGAFSTVGVILIATGRWDRPPALWGLLAGLLLMFSVGLLDDLRTVHWKTRWAIQAFSVATVLSAISGIQPSSMPALAWLGFWPLQLLALLGGVWIINAFNFMDGIDGIAASEAIFISVAGGAFWALSGERWMAEVLWLMAAAATGFLLLNWPPAKIFLGDCGSGALGFLVASNLLLAAHVPGRLFWPMLVLPCVFISDATVTLIRRIVTKQKWHQAHRSHAYQHAAVRWGHRRTTLAVIGVNIFWALPMACLAFRLPAAGPLLVLAAFTPLVVLALKLCAGASPVSLTSSSVGANVLTNLLTKLTW